MTLINLFYCSFNFIDPMNPKEQIPGSKPKKFIKKTNPNNPTLVSNSIHTLFNPEYLVGSQERQKIRRSNSLNNGLLASKIPRSHSQMLFNYDSLKQAEKDFMKKKLGPSSLKNSSLILQRKTESRGKHVRFPSVDLSKQDYLRSFNFMELNRIKNKQKQPYNIISCVPTPNI